MKTEDKDKTPLPRQPLHKIEIEQKNGLFFVTVDGKQLLHTRKARTHKAGTTRPETFLTADSAYRAAEKEIARQRKLAADPQCPDVATFQLIKE